MKGALLALRADPRPGHRPVVYASDMRTALRALLVLASLLAGAVGCGSPEKTPPPISSGGGGGDGGGGGCTPELLAESIASTRYYVAIAELGADNEACDGLAPTDEGDGHCPFKDLSSPRTRSLLDGVAGVRVDLRAGTYVVSGWDGLRVTGLGTSESERVVLSAYPGEDVTLDVAAPDGAPCMDDTAPTRPECVREVVRVSGQYTAVQGLTIRNGLGYNLEVTGGAHHVVRCNHLTETVEFPLRSDSLKLDGGATDVLLQRNELSRFRSQAIDITGVEQVVVEENDIHDPFDADAGAVGAKFGARDIVIRNNTIHDLGTDTQTKAFSLGGTGSAHEGDFEAYEVQVTGNRVLGVTGILAQLVSCSHCTIADNDVSDVSAGVLFSAAATGLPECGASPSGCRASEGTRITGNRLRGLDGAGDPAVANVFLFVEPGETTGFSAGGNVYCAPSAELARFGWEANLVDFATWVSLTGTDASSVALRDSDARCE